MSRFECQLCGRVVKRGTTQHHLIPRTCHSNRWFKKRYTREQLSQTIDVCRDCHSAIHRLIPDEKELGRHHNSLDSLLAHPEVAKFAAWAHKQKCSSRCVHVPAPQPQAPNGRAKPTLLAGIIGKRIDILVRRLGRRCASKGIAGSAARSRFGGSTKRIITSQQVVVVLWRGLRCRCTGRG